MQYLPVAVARIDQKTSHDAVAVVGALISENLLSALFFLEELINDSAP